MAATLTPRPGVVPASKPYKIDNKTVRDVFVLKHGKAEKTWQMDRTSNSPWTQVRALPLSRLDMASRFSCFFFLSSTHIRLATTACLPLSHSPRLDSTCRHLPTRLDPRAHFVRLATQDEFKRMVDTCANEKVPVPTRKEVDERFGEMQDLIGKVITEVGRLHLPPSPPRSPAI